jgi:GNAT superfamily N-acetyltransferase
MPQHLVRAASLADVPEVRCLEEEWLRSGDIIGMVPTPVDALERSVGGCFLVAEQAGGLVGFLLGHCRKNDGAMSAVMPGGVRYLDVEALYVAPAHRSAGIGAALMDAATAWASQQGIAHLSVFTATRNVEAVLRFYRSHGFESWGVQLVRDLDPP